MERKRIFNLIYSLAIPFITINIAIFTWQLSRQAMDTNNRMARICFSFALVGGFILLIVLIIHLIFFLRNKIRYREENVGNRLIPSIRHNISLRRQNSIPKTGRLRIEDQGQIGYNRFGSYNRNLDVSSQVFPIIIDNKEIEITLESLIFDEKILDERCGICKLTFNHGQIAIFCPQCETLYHKDHLINWFQTNNHCPICQYIIIKS